MSLGFTPIVLLSAMAFGALRLLGRRRRAIPVAAPRHASERTVGQSVRQPPEAIRSEQPMIAVAESIETAAIRKAYLLGSHRSGRQTDATTILLDVMSGPGVAMVLLRASHAAHRASRQFPLCWQRCCKSFPPLSRLQTRGGQPRARLPSIAVPDSVEGRRRSHIERRPETQSGLRGSDDARYG
jgi:hypothetical protein